MGHTHNFNTCIERSRGQLVQLLHGDDTVPRRLLPNPRPTLPRRTRTSAPPSAACVRGRSVRDLCRAAPRAHLGHLPRRRVQARGRRRDRAGHSCRPEVDEYERLGGFDRRLRVAGEDRNVGADRCPLPGLVRDRTAGRYHCWLRSLISGSARSGAAIRDDPADDRSRHRVHRAGQARERPPRSEKGAAPNGRSCSARARSSPVTGRRRAVQLERPLSDPLSMCRLAGGEDRWADGPSPGKNGTDCERLLGRSPRRVDTTGRGKDRPLWSVMIPT